jgi:hypothetical protein
VVPNVKRCQDMTLATTGSLSTHDQRLARALHGEALWPRKSDQLRPILERLDNVLAMDSADTETEHRGHPQPGRPCRGRRHPRGWVVR